MPMPRRTLAALLAVAALGLAACGDDGSDVDRLRDEAGELQQRGEELEDKAAREAAEGRAGRDQDGGGGGRRARRDAEDLAGDAKDTANDAIEDVKDDAAIPEEAVQQLEEAQEQLKNATP